MKKQSIAIITVILVCTSVFAAGSITAGAGYGGQVIPQEDSLKSINVSGVPKELSPSFFLGVDFELHNHLSFYGDFSYALKMSKSAITYPTADEFKTLCGEGTTDELSSAIDKLMTPLLLNSFSASTLSFNTGVGYTVHMGNNFTLMVGGGFELKYYFVFADEMDLSSDYYQLEDTGISSAAFQTLYAAEYIHDEIQSMLSKTVVLGAGLKIKGTYRFNKHLGISAQMNPTFGFKVFSNPEVENNKTKHVQSTIGEPALNKAANRFSDMHSQTKFISGAFSLGLSFIF